MKASQAGRRPLIVVAVAVGLLLVIVSSAVLVGAQRGKSRRTRLPAEARDRVRSDHRSHRERAARPRHHVRRPNGHGADADRVTRPHVPAHRRLRHAQPPAPARGALPNRPVELCPPTRADRCRSSRPSGSRLKAAGRIALVGGKVVVLDADADPLVEPLQPDLPVPRKPARSDVAWTRWVVEPYRATAPTRRATATPNLNYWNLCGAGRHGGSAVVLAAADRLPGRDRHRAATSSTRTRPKGSPGRCPDRRSPSRAGQRIGTYWSGLGRGQRLHRPRPRLHHVPRRWPPSRPTWQSTGMAVFANGTASRSTRPSALLADEHPDGASTGRSPATTPTTGPKPGTPR